MGECEDECDGYKYRRNAYEGDDYGNKATRLDRKPR